MNAYRTKPRTPSEIRTDMALVLHHARPEVEHIHLIPCDFEQVASAPEQFRCTKQKDGTIVTVFNHRLVQIVEIT